MEGNFEKREKIDLFAVFPLFLLRKRETRYQTFDPGGSNSVIPFTISTNIDSEHWIRIGWGDGYGYMIGWGEILTQNGVGMGLHEVAVVIAICSTTTQNHNCPMPTLPPRDLYRQHGPWSILRVLMGDLGLRCGRWT